mgnify:CR=1 FL=1
MSNNIYEDCVPCEKCGHPFLPIDDETICDECEEDDEGRKTSQQEKTGPDTC